MTNEDDGDDEVYQTGEIDWRALWTDLDLDEPDAIGSKVVSHTQARLVAEVYTDRNPGHALQEAVDDGALIANYTESAGDDASGPVLRGYHLPGGEST